jgi:hypothetical protein
MRQSAIIVPGGHLPASGARHFRWHLFADRAAVRKISRPACPRTRRPAVFPNLNGRQGNFTFDYRSKHSSSAMPSLLRATEVVE